MTISYAQPLLSDERGKGLAILKGVVESCGASPTVNGRITLRVNEPKPKAE